MATKKHSNPAPPTGTVTLTGFPADKKVAVIQVVRQITGIDLEGCKELVETLPQIVTESERPDVLERDRQKLEAVGATVKVIGIAAAQSRFEAAMSRLDRPLPDVETLHRRLQVLQADVWNAQAVVQSVEWAIRQELDADNDPAHSLMRALRPAIELLERAARGLDSVVLLAPAEAQGVANG